MDALCDKCKKTMRKKGTLMMSNSKFEVLVCEACGAEKKRAIAVIGGSGPATY